MLRIDDPNENDVLIITASGHISKEDLDGVKPRLAELLERPGRLRFYVELKDVSGFGIGALWEDIKFDIKYRSQYDRTAIVGDRTWQALAARLAGPLFGAKVRFFETSSREEAWRWVNEQSATARPERTSP